MYVMYIEMLFSADEKYVYRLVRLNIKHIILPYSICIKYFFRYFNLICIIDSIYYIFSYM